MAFFKGGGWGVVGAIALSAVFSRRPKVPKAPSVPTKSSVSKAAEARIERRKQTRQRGNVYTTAESRRGLPTTVGPTLTKNSKRSQGKKSAYRSNYRG